MVDSSVRMSATERVLLNRMVTEQGVTDQTALIRHLKHSGLFRKEIAALTELLADRDRRRAEGEEVSDEMFDMEVMYHCNFLHRYYTDLYHKIARRDMNMELLGHLIDELERIENGEFDMHDGAYRVGKLTQKIYMESALKESARRDAEIQASIHGDKPHRALTYRQYKLSKLAERVVDTAAPSSFPTDPASTSSSVAVADPMAGVKLQAKGGRA